MVYHLVNKNCTLKVSKNLMNMGWKKLRLKLKSMCVAVVKIAWKKRDDKIY